MPGFSIGPPSSFMSGEEWCELHFEDCRVPGGDILLGPAASRNRSRKLQHRAARQCSRSLAFGRYAYDKARGMPRRASSSAGPLCEFRAAMEVREMAIKLESAQLLLYRRRTSADAACRPPNETASPRPPATRPEFEVASEAVADNGRASAYSRETLVRNTACGAPAADDRRRLDRDAEEPHREHVFDRRFDQRNRRADAAE